MTKTRTALEVLAVFGMQYGLARLLGKATTYAEEREERDLSGVIPAQAKPAEAPVRV